jgi:hypothetical protein
MPYVNISRFTKFSIAVSDMMKMGLARIAKLHKIFTKRTHFAASLHLSDT